MAPRLLREKEKKLEAMKESRLLPDPPSAMTHNLQQVDRQDEESGFGTGSTSRGVNSPFGGSTSSLGAGSLSYDDKPLEGRSYVRGRGRGFSSLDTTENPGGLNGNATSRRETSSPDIQSKSRQLSSRLGCSS